MQFSKAIFAVFLAGVVVACAAPTSRSTAADRLYVMDCGHNAALDESRWTPGINVGKPIDLSDNCYLIRHDGQWLLWDTGYPDAIADKPLTSPVGTATRSKTLASQLAEIGVKPADIQWVAVSHTHPDHVGNVGMFPNATLLIQKTELDWAFAPGKPAPFQRDRPIRAIEGDLDVFGDGSVTLLSTPGHTPGHQSLLVHLPTTGWIVLSGDAVHFRDNWEQRRVPSVNANAEQTQASMQRLAQVLADKHAELWINHDESQSLSQKHSPAFYD
ncbi:N-acyl homoserine lactonase family protein [Scleromatobacter humisilvae]|uniref:N-acyl homoserine lactonase family protein n=1 Tax=Scleromatobacter humisilvae TaxID=2897159 RepID=A0A9X1YQ79_9BURK|nr:N-acyl homoserine lactonase family protein [Scleromatobacter humisilvae]MCK9689440.1 N-acyl homoserine lactonase family protein [Scleromatobacter humisilvae]